MTDNTHEATQTVEERFLKELCWQDSDGKWFLNGTPDTVPKILHFITQERTRLKEELLRCIRSETDTTYYLAVAKDSPLLAKTNN